MALGAQLDEAELAASREQRQKARSSAAAKRKEAQKDRRAQGLKDAKTWGKGGLEMWTSPQETEAGEEEMGPGEAVAEVSPEAQAALVAKLDDKVRRSIEMMPDGPGKETALKAALRDMADGEDDALVGFGKAEATNSAHARRMEARFKAKAFAVSEASDLKPN